MDENTVECRYVRESTKDTSHRIQRSSELVKLGKVLLDESADCIEDGHRVDQLGNILHSTNQNIIASYAYRLHKPSKRNRILLRLLPGYRAYMWIGHDVYYEYCEA